MKSNIVKKSQPLITAAFNLGTREQDLLTLMFKELKSKNYKVDEKNFHEKEVQTEFKFTTNQLREQFKLSKSGLYKMLDKATDSAMGKMASIKDPSSNKFEKFTLISYARFENGQLHLRVDKSTAALMLNYSKGFAVVDFDLSIKLAGAYEKRILDFISLNKKEDRVYSIGEFCRMMDVKISDFKSFDSFRKSVLEKPVKRLMTTSNGLWTAKEGYPKGYTISKTGRSHRDTDKITFKLQYNDPNKKSKVDMKFIFEDSEFISVGIVYDTLVNQFDESKTLEEHGLDKPSILNFMNHIFDDPKYQSVMPQLTILMNK